ncbi:MAG: nuclear transport factor 2 family protein [Afipia sp.]|nr:nuclear transport factor 2 family protein [Afipia sp.]
MDPRVAEVNAAMSNYFDGLYRSDVSLLGKVFHPQSLYACATEGTLTHLNMAQYFPIVDKRPSPASRNEPRADKIVSIEFAGPVTAFFHTECAIGQKHFTDFLTFVHLDARWQIISKVFHFDLRNS